jgi:uncharacterized protein YxeA
MNRRTLNLAAVLIIVVFTLSFVAALPVQSHGTNTIISKLRELKDELEEQHPALQNKVNAVIHQIKAGAFIGALNKLQYDVKKSIVAWVQDLNKREVLLKLVDEIIELIEGKLCPKLKPDFKITAEPMNLEIVQGSFDTSAITIISKRGFNEEVVLTNTISASGVTLSLNPSTLTPPHCGSATSILKVKVASNVAPGNYEITVTGTSGSLQHNVTITLTVIVRPPPTPNFSITASPNTLTIQKGDSDTSVIAVTSMVGFSQPVDLAVKSAKIAGVNTTLSPTKVVPPSNLFAISILTVDVATDASLGTFNIIIAGSSGSLTHTATISLIVTAPPTPPTPDFSINAYPTELTIEQGTSATSAIIVVSLREFSQTVNLAITSALVAGVNISLNPSQVTPQPDGFVASTLTIDVGKTAVPDDYTITVSGTSGMLTRTVSFSLNVTYETTPPVIVSVLRLPETPSYNQSVTVLASVIDLGSGVKQVTLNYSSGAIWTNVNMIFTDEFYRGTIPAFPFDTLVEYQVYAVDSNGNVADPSALQSYKVIDPYAPLLAIDVPTQGSYLSGTVPIKVLMQDQNSGGESGFARAELSINNIIVTTWQPQLPALPVVYVWSTATFGPDGNYVIKLSVWDKAANVAEKSLTVTVDNTLPSAVINEPVSGGFLRLSVLVKVAGSDANFEKMEVRIDNTLIKTYTASGSEILELNTRTYSDGVHSVTLMVYDKAGNIKQVNVNATVDNAPPSIGSISWSPKEPAANVDIKINATVTEPAYGSGVQSVTFWFKNKTMDDWQSVSMQFKTGNWTTTLSKQSDTNVRFFIEAFDNAGNNVLSERKELIVAASPSVPLALILAIIILIAAIIGGSIYYLRRKQKGQTSVSPAPVTAAPRTFYSPAQLLLPTSTRKAARLKTRSGSSARSVRAARSRKL